MDFLYDCMNNISKLDEGLIPTVSLIRPPNMYANVSVYGLHIGGWYDIFLGGTIRGYRGYNEYGGTTARGHQKMILGPWTHGMWALRNQGELTYPSNSLGASLMGKWEREILENDLADVENPDLWTGNKIAYYLMGDVNDPKVDANKWKYAKEWPLNYKLNPWYFGKSSDGSLILVDNGTTLSPNNLSYLYDPVNPVMTRGGNNLYSSPMGPVNQIPVELDENGNLRSDILLFESEKLSKPYTVEGDLKATLFIKSNCTDTDFMVKLCDIYPDGTRMLIMDSALRTRYRNVNFTAFSLAEMNISENFIVPETEYELTIDLTATAYQFNTGHKIGITITSSNYNRFSVNPNTGGTIAQHFSEGLIANNTIITGPGKSCIWFPEL
jgi:uncharacterized protein